MAKQYQKPVMTNKVTKSTALKNSIYCNFAEAVDGGGEINS